MVITTKGYVHSKQEHEISHDLELSVDRKYMPVGLMTYYIAICTT